MRTAWKNEPEGLISHKSNPNPTVSASKESHWRVNKQGRVTGSSTQAQWGSPGAEVQEMEGWSWLWSDTDMGHTDNLYSGPKASKATAVRVPADHTETVHSKLSEGYYEPWRGWENSSLDFV